MEGFCKACLVKYENPSDLLQYTEKNRRLFVYFTGLQVKPNDVFPFRICHACFLKVKMGCVFKKQCRTSDKKLNHFLSLKEAGEETDFSTYLQKNEGSEIFKFPLNGTSTPTYQKQKDDDNVSTSTSIRNFMADFLRDDEVPDTEAHIIQEMIEQEADVLDESLDSQWLQDDISIASDFRFSPYSTPLSKQNYKPLLNFTPTKEEPRKENQTGRKDLLSAKKQLLDSESCSSTETQSTISQNKNTDKEISDQSCIASKNLSSPASKSNTSSIKLERDIDYESYVAKKRILLNSKTNSDNNEPEQIMQQGKDMETFLAAKSILLNSKSNSSINDNTEVIDETQNIAEKVMYEFDEIHTNQDFVQEMAHKGFYIENVDATENTLRIDDIGDVSGKKDHIDKNLEKLLNNTNDDIISLSALLASPSSELAPVCNDIIATPSVHQGLSGANTPSIESILFGKKIDDEENTCKDIQDMDMEPKKEVTNNEADKESEVDILGDFFNKNTGKYLGEFVKDPEEIFEEYTNPKLDGFIPGKSQFDITDFSCKLCNERYKSERGLKIHFAKAHNLKIISQRKKEPRFEIPCDRCGKIFSRKSNLKKHIQVMHVAPKQAVTCSECSLKFSSAGRLKLHMFAHNGIKHKPEGINKLELVCPICGHMSSHPANHKTHIARHNKDYAFKCDFCDHGFYRKNDLQIHMRRHMNEKPFKCTQCSNSFRRKDQLQIHLKRHSGQRPYICEICNNAFVTSTKLKNHKKISKTCQNMKIEAALKENKAIEESIEQLFVEETQVLDDLLKKHLPHKDILPDEQNVHKKVEDTASAKESMLQNVEDDKISLSDMFTIPIVMKETANVEL